VLCHALVRSPLLGLGWQSLLVHVVNEKVVCRRPKMPCLKCGCPWWLGEDWDAKCARCAWDCLSSGYDDDSQPLPPYRKKWEAFTAAIRAGNTPECTPKPKGKR
jgi:hypothetical protein